ncbi:putative ABC transporter, substrate-binding protein [Bradyrhizobium sp. ORS 375]|uniref:ABC transporter substrate-binding protein n=1 Tax=Bradyrhizobium sp. (strain ORS 375) TaxID=566679 RepID=UPI0002408624|nr:ABC transporter substrate-binding protein [Bradyrhizobium sp. ORS 375]CCD96122.1 putative ABC transporter, substrate-binding protein [Bradyrhizobium sp. ORS 375]
MTTSSRIVPAPDAGVSRRRLLTGAAAAGASAISLYFPAVRAAEAGTIRIGWIAAVSGPGALFGEAVPFVKAQMEKIFAGGLEIGGKRYSVEILLRDSQSSINTATQAVTELITRQKVDLIVAPEGLAAVGGGQMATINRTPMISTLFPSDAMVAMRGGPQAYSNNGTPWAFHFLFETPDITAAYLGMWEPVRKRLNQKVGTFYVDQPAARGFADPERGLPAALKSGGYSNVEGGMFKIETDDFSNQVSTFKSADAQMLTGFMFANHFASFWRGAAQAGYRPEIVTIAGAFMFPGGIDALGDRGDGLSTEIWWSPQLPYASSLTGESAKALAAAWEDKQGAQWTPVLGYTHALWEVAVNALKTSGDPKNKEAVRAAFAKTKLDTVVGTVDFASGPVQGIAKTPLVAGQWRRTKTGKYKYDLRVTYKGSTSGFEVQDEFKLLSELS